MKQLVLDLHADAPPRFDNFVEAGNEELLVALRHTVRGDGHLYLWGEAGSGRTHLLRAASAAAAAAGRPTCYLSASEIATALPELPAALLAIDDIDALAPAAQIALFNAFNRARETRQTLLLAGSAPPRALTLREDLRTRVGQCLVYELHALDDDARAMIIATLAQRRGLFLGDDVIQFLLRHGRRDLPSLIAAVDALDRATLERKRPATVPLLRELIQGGLEL